MTEAGSKVPLMNLLGFLLVLNPKDPTVRNRSSEKLPCMCAYRAQCPHTQAYPAASRPPPQRRGLPATNRALMGPLGLRLEVDLGFRIMENKMETTIVYWGYIGITEKKMETTIMENVNEIKLNDYNSV